METYKYLGILEADTIKHERKNRKKYTSEERQNFSKSNYIAEISSNRKNSWCPPRKIHGAILKVDERTSTNELENKKTNDNA